MLQKRYGYKFTVLEKHMRMIVNFTQNPCIYFVLYIIEEIKLIKFNS